MKQFIKVILITSILLFVPFFVRATTIDFNVDPVYDYLGRSKITAFLQKIGTNAYFYIEDGYYQTLDMEEKKELTEIIKDLSQEFDETIYPSLTELFSSEWKPGIDEDDKITILLTRIKEENGGYFNQGDEFPIAQVPMSNEREMVYLNVNYIESPLAKSYLAHEFVHLITFNQKDRIYGSEEETWLNEARAEIAPTLLGYDDDYSNSNLKERVRTFSQNPGDPLAEWKALSADYGVVNLFAQYLLDHYGVEILADSLKSAQAGIPSLDYALSKNRHSEDFARIFTDWLIAVLVNDCGIGPKYCYLNQNLKNLKILPQLNYLPLAEESTLSVTDYIKDWAGSWIKFIGGKGTLKLEFIGDSKIDFTVPYIIQNSAGQYVVNFMELDESQRGMLYLSSFGKIYSSLIMIPSAQEKVEGFDGIESFRRLIWTASIINEDEEENEELINQLLAQIAALQAQIVQIQAQISAILAQRGGTTVCSGFENDLYYGMKDNNEVRCFQQFLKDQGEKIYPEGFVTGNFLTLTLEAVIRFQEEYAEEILTPLGLEQGTGYFGSLTRQKANKLIHR